MEFFFIYQRFSIRIRRTTYRLSIFLKDEINNNTQDISVFSSQVHPSALDLCRSKINPSRALDVPCMMNLLW